MWPGMIQLGVALIQAGRALKFREDSRTLSETLKEVYRLGLSVDRLDVRKATLEDTFIKLTGIKELLEIEPAMEGNPNGDL